MNKDIWQDIYTGNEEAAKQAAEELKRNMDDKKSVWRCDECGDMYDSTDTTWRYDPVNGPQHYHSSIQGHASSTRFDDLFIADQLRERLEAIVQSGADWYDEPNVELNLYSPNEILTTVRNLERMIYYLESGAGY